MSALWTAAEIAAATGGTVHGDFTCTGVAFDSREIGPGDLFFALKGEQSDGHRFVAGALANGAVGAVVSESIEGPHILVPDTMRALEALGIASRARVEAKVIGVTGSAGKTGTKEALYAALERNAPGYAHRSVKSYNNHVGVPLSLARMPRDTKFGVFEMGMNHAAELSALTQFVRPHVAIITTIAPAHIEHFKDESGIADAKAEIFEGLVESGLAIIPRDNVHYPRLRGHAEKYAAKIISFGFSAEADVRCIDHLASEDGGSIVTAQLPGAMLQYRLSQPGDHWVSNSLAVLAAVQAVGADLAVAGLALADMGGLKGRGARHTVSVTGGSALLVDESYNANPASMAATLGEFGRVNASARIAVLGAMRELGEQGPEFHRALKAPIESAGIDFTLLVGEEMAPLAEALAGDVAWAGKFAHCATASEAITAIEPLLKPDVAVLVKGSNSIGLSALVAHLQGGGD
jgi:UDP-N-acetylmuramoyl-tripeptide--D-alanyl-D-alanine ligase